MRLSTHHRELLRGTEREQLAEVLALIRATSPEAFHDAGSLPTRVFVDQPLRDIPHASFVLPYEPDDRRPPELRAVIERGVRETWLDGAGQRLSERQVVADVRRGARPAAKSE